MKKLSLLLIAMLCGIGFTAQATTDGTSVVATVIDINVRGNKAQLVINDNFARIDNAADGSYMLFDRKSQQGYLIFPQTRQVMSMVANHHTKVPTGSIRLLPANTASTKMMGFESRRYRLMTDNQHCGDVFASKQALQQFGMSRMLSATSNMIEQQMQAMGPYLFVIDNCTQASMRILAFSDQIGLPMRIYDKKGMLISDVVRIDTNTVVNSAIMSLPKNYQIVSSAKQLSPTQQLIQNARRYSPQFNNAYRAIQNFSND